MQNQSTSRSLMSTCDADVYYTFITWMKTQPETLRLRFNLCSADYVSASNKSEYKPS